MAELESYQNLAPQHRKFVDEYLKTAPGGWNGAEAARNAGYSERTAAQQASRLLTNDNVKAAIQERLDELKMSADDVLLGLREIAISSMADFISITETESGIKTLVLDLEKAEKAGKLHLIKSLSFNKDGDLSKIELYDKQAALVQIGRHHKLFTDKVELSGDGEPIPIIITGMDMNEL